MDESPGGARRVTLALLVVAVVVLAAASTFAVIKYRDYSRTSSKSSERTTVAAIAGQYAVDFSSIDYRHMAADIAAASKNATATFAKKYEATVKLFEPLYAKGKVVQTTSVERTAVTSISSDSAVVLVALAGSSTNARTSTPTQQLFRFQLTLNKVDGKWLTDNVTTI
jgi:Mce-associated membrane protein